MTITKEFIDHVAPEHGRTSCDDSNLNNGFGAILKTFDRVTGRHEVYHPRCVRCYLLSNIDGNDKELDFSVEVVVNLIPNSQRIKGV